MTEDLIEKIEQLFERHKDLDGYFCFVADASREAVFIMNICNPFDSFSALMEPSAWKNEFQDGDILILTSNPDTLTKDQEDQIENNQELLEWIKGQFDQKGIEELENAQ